MCTLFCVLHSRLVDYRWFACYAYLVSTLFSKYHFGHVSGAFSSPTQRQWPSTCHHTERCYGNLAPFSRCCRWCFRHDTKPPCCHNRGCTMGFPNTQATDSIGGCGPPTGDSEGRSKCQTTDPITEKTSVSVRVMKCNACSDISEATYFARPHITWMRVKYFGLLLHLLHVQAGCPGT